LCDKHVRIDTKIYYIGSIHLIGSTYTI